ncbi:MAG: hypothetical protein ACTHQM_01365 [Thermoanaerobaculia bacterium]
MLRALYTLIALVVIGGFAYGNWRGMELTSSKKGFVPQGMRGAHGGARTFWYGGYRGGK